MRRAAPNSVDAIDALETRSTRRTRRSPGTGRPRWVVGGRRTLVLLGFADVQRGDRNIVTSSTPAQAPGYILTKFPQVGRAVALPRRPSAGWLRQTGVRRGGRAEAVGELPAAGRRLGLPDLLSKLFVDLRDALAEAAIAPRRAGKGVWERDGTLPGFKLTPRSQLTDELVILPKLFRRLAEYLTLDEPGKVSLAGFPAFLPTSNDKLFAGPAGQATHLDTLIQRKGQTLKLTLPPSRSSSRRAGRRPAAAGICPAQPTGIARVR